MSWLTTPSESANSCVQVHGAPCESGSCVEATVGAAGDVLLRSDLVPEVVLSITRAEWVSFRAAIKAGFFDGV